MSEERKRHPKNAEGPFYVEYGCCLKCMAPHQAAPDLMGYDEDEGHCYFRKQPQTKEEIYRTLCAIRFSDVGAVRYAGDDSEILRRLVESESAEECDQPVPANAKPVLRNHVTFLVKPSTSEPEGVTPQTLHEIAESFRNYCNNQGSHISTTQITVKGQAVSFSYSWTSEQYEVIATMDDSNANRVLISHSHLWKPGSIAVSLYLYDWLRSSERFESIQWYTAEDWLAGRKNWQETPI